MYPAINSYSQFSTQGNLKSVPDKPWALDVSAVPWLPFSEDWSTGQLETNLWVAEANSNWRIAGQVGNPAPSVEFSYNPPATNYQKTLTSRWLSGRMIDGSIFLRYDLKHSLVNPTGQEFLKVQICTDTAWHTVLVDSNAVSFNWTERKVNLNEYAKGNIFKIRFLAEGHNSLDIFNWLIDNISIYRKCNAPTNLDANINFPSMTGFKLVWDPPSGGTGNSALLAWDNGINNDAIGLQGGGTFSVAVRFTPAQLTEYAGTYLTKIRMFPYRPNGIITLKVWNGANASQLMIAQAIGSYTAGVWNEFTLNTPVLVTGTSELWFGYTVTHTATDYVAGCDNGPAVSPFGDMISLDGSVWESMSVSYGLNYNWNLEGYVEPYGMNSIPSLEANSKEFKSNAQKSINSQTKISRMQRDLIYYEIFRDNEYRDTTSNTDYVDSTANYPDWHCYFVRAVYRDCISEFSNESCWGPRKKFEPEILSLYPVPSDKSLTIEIKSSTNSLKITDFHYRTVYSATNLNPGAYSVNTSSFKEGIYFIQAVDETGSIQSSKFIVNH